MTEKKYFTPVETKTIHKAIFAWQDEEEERWLEEMSIKGWHLTGTAPFTYYFQKGDFKRMIYRLDYKFTTSKDYQDYLQIFRDSGWELVCVMSNWHYFRILPENDRIPEIYNDNRSRVIKYERLLAGLVPFFVIIWVIPPSFIYRSGSDFGAWWMVVTLIGLSIKILFIYAFVRVAARVIRLRKAQQE